MNNASPKVSVIIPAYNRASIIGRAIDSALNQSIQDIEVIVVDDASTDGTETLVKSYSDRRVEYIKHDKNLYTAAARNIGMSVARGQYIAFLDSDDEWLPNKLQLQLSVIEQYGPEWGCVYSGANIYKDAQSVPVLYQPSREGSLLKDYLTSKIVIWTPTFFV